MAIAKEQLRQIIKENDLKSAGDVYALLKDSFKELLQELLEAELDVSMGYDKNNKGDIDTDNKRNGYSPKTVKSEFGEFQLDIPRDRKGEFEPEIVPKYCRDISGIEDKVISLYARGMTTRDIAAELQELYGIHYKMREDGRILNRDAYVILGVDLEGNKDILSITIGANESSKFWLGMLNDLKNRGVRDVLFFCVDGLSGFREAIEAVYPNAQVQRCIIHMLRNSFKYVSYKDLKSFASDFKAIYKAPSEEAALKELEDVKEKWGRKYPFAISNWESNWDVIRPFFEFSDDIRRIMYTTNIIEGVNRQFRKVTKTKSVFPNDSSLEKMLYLASQNVMQKWKMRYRNWDLVLSQLTILYKDRMKEFL